MTQIKHGHAKHGHRSPEHRVWTQMLSRCYCCTANGYANYGGRGITVCDRWRGSDGFVNFLADMGPRPSLRHSIDRFPDNNGNYEPGNCRWATPSQQQRNKRSNRLLTHDGRTMCMADWAMETGIDVNALTVRLRLGWSVVDALTKPVRPKKKAHTLTHDGETLRIGAWAARLGVVGQTILYRLRRGWTVAEAVTTPRDDGRVPKRYR